MPKKLKDKQKWFVVVNPHAGTNKCIRDWPEIKSLLEEAGFDFTFVMTEKIYHALYLVRQAIEVDGFQSILVVGGDGTLNEAVNGIMRQFRFPSDEIRIGMITVGTGNDWGRMYEIPAEYKDQVKILRKGHTFLQDVGMVKYRYAADEEKRYFVNIAGMGYDALVAKKTNTLKQMGKGGILTYIVSLLSGLFQYENTELSIEADGKKVYSGKVFSLSIGICKYNGGGMMQLPNAIPDDGLFDVTLIEKTTKMRVIRNIKNLYDGSFIKMKEVKTFTGKKFSITAFPPDKLNLETDGESLGHSPLDFEIIPQSVCLVVRKKYSEIK
jgi:YegS/Rv2252/BmrU family lipid kinase